MSITLPIALHTPITSYDRHGLWLSLILGSRPDALSWAASAFLGLESVTDQGKPLLRPYTPYSWNLKQEKILSVQFANLKAETLRRPAFSLLPVAKDMLDHGWYLMGDVDAFYLSATTDCRRQHSRYLLLLYGYDEERQGVYAVGNTAEGPCRPLWLPYDEFEHSLTKSLLDTHYMDFLQIHPEAHFSVDSHAVLQAVQAYVSHGLPAVRRWLEQEDGGSTWQDRQSLLAFQEHTLLTEQALQGGGLSDAAHTYRAAVVNEVVGFWTAYTTGNSSGEWRQPLSQAIAQEERILGALVEAEVSVKEVASCP